ncbi:MAG: DUF177 domain-containing protein [bacterium]|nr:DUF177 domain-containing protein [bacterium]
MMLDLAKLTFDSETISGVEVVKLRDSVGAEHEVECDVRVLVRNVAETFRINGDVRGRFSTACHKCLDPTDVVVESSFELVVQRLGRGLDEEVVDEDFISLPFGKNELSLDRQICESIIVSIPIQSYCRDSCEGLCTRCGTNLNKNTCECAAETDRRWDALRNL